MKKILTILAMTAAILAVSCKKDDKKEDKGKDDNDKEALIKIDGEFGDWAALPAGIVSTAKTDPNAPWDGVKEIRCCADADFVYFYIKYDSQTAKDQLAEGDKLNIRLCFNTDGEFTTGYQRYFLEYYDFIIEGPLADGEGKWAAFDGTLHQHSGGTASADFHALLEPEHGLVTGKGEGAEYEIMMAREIFNNAVPAGHKMGDEFYTGIRFYCSGWNELSNMPNASMSEGEGTGWGHMMKVTTAK